MMLNSNKIIIKLFLVLVTFGLYGLVWMKEITDEVKELGKPLPFMSGGKALFLELITLGIYMFFWSWKIGDTLDYIHQSSGNKKKGLKVKYLICIWLCAPVGFYLMEREIEEIKSAGQADCSILSEQKEQIESNIDVRIIIISGLALLLLIPSTLIVRQCFTYESNILIRQLVVKLVMTFQGIFSVSIYQVSFITSGMAILGILPLYFTQSYLSKGYKAIRNIAALFTVLTALCLFTLGGGYHLFFFDYGYFSISYMIGLAMGICASFAALSSALLCAWESLQYGSMKSVKLVVLLVGYCVFSIAFIWYALLTVFLSVTDALFSMPRQMTGLIIPYIVFYIIRLVLRKQ